MTGSLCKREVLAGVQTPSSAQLALSDGEWAKKPITPSRPYPCGKSVCIERLAHGQGHTAKGRSEGKPFSRAEPFTECEAGRLYCVVIGRDRIEVLPETSMVSRAERLGHFITDAEPPFGSVVEVLCQDHVGTYRLPCLCISTPEGLRNERTGDTSLR